MTTLKNGTWVLIADGEKALFLENVTDGEDPHLQVRRKEEQDNPSDLDQSANRPGRMQEGRPGGEASGPRSAFQDTDWHQLAKDRFADDLAELLYKQAHRGKYDSLVLVAAPGVLGEIRDKMHQEVRQKVIGEVAKTLTNHSIDDIEKIVKEDLAAA
ncbi:host attachment family protein [Oceaniglobus roseus]|uniref:host attachment family protein n=1 Tax=Oceaniglobus roseus TaxID=1737570 RepID=UPI000C7ED05E|nr:host attachment family protein [Kandeliimicrobium roseum]